MGIKPTRPDTNYGYVRRGQRLAEGLYEVAKFEEKPDLPTATEYFSSGEYYWNSGMFAWQASTILGELERQLPPSRAAIGEIASAWLTDTRQQKLRNLYPSLTKISIDYAVMENAPRVLVVEMDCNWVDVGTWPAIEGVIDADTNGNITAGALVRHLDSRGNIVVSEEKHLVATIGVEDLIVVHSPDATLVCRKDQAHRLKDMVEGIHETFDQEYA